MGDRASTSSDDERLGRWTDTVLLLGGRVLPYLAVTLIALGLALCYTLTYLLGGASSVAPGLFLLLILPAAARFRYRGALLASVTATVLAGPMMPLDVSSGTQQELSVWIGRGLTFVVVGIVTAALVNRVQAARLRELELAREERDLATRKAAVIATVSHEFRTPLTIIAGVARTLEHQGMISPEGEPLLKGLADATRRLVDLVTTVGAVMEHDESFVRPEPIVLRELLDHVIDHLGVQDPHGQVVIEVDRSAELAECDRLMLGQLLRHIIENAVKFSPPSERVKVSVRRAGARLLVVVMDRGPGIDGEFLHRSDPFSQGDGSLTRTKQGLGLGLFAAGRLAEILGGSIRFEARPGGGTIASINIQGPNPATPLPLAPASTPRSAAS